MEVLEHRLVTLTGAAGSGKTRLAIEVGRAVVDDLDDGVAFVPLAAITDPGLVANAIRTTIALPENPNRPTLDTLVEAGWLHSFPSRAGDNPGRQKSDYLINPKVAELAHGE